MGETDSNLLREHGEIISAMSANVRNVENAISSLCKNFDGFFARCDARHAVVDGQINNAHSRISTAKDNFATEFSKIATQLSQIDKGLEKLNGDLRVLQIKAGLWGALSGSITTLVAIIIFWFTVMGKGH